MIRKINTSDILSVGQNNIKADEMKLSINKSLTLRDLMAYIQI